MHLPSSIRSVREIFRGRTIDLPADPGVYAFWWVAERERLLSSNRCITLRGPKGDPVKVEYRDWWPPELAYPCLYVGKSTNIRKRFSLHLKRDCKGRLHEPAVDNRKVEPRTTSCQLRWGIEHVFPAEQDPLQVILDSVGFSFTTDFPENAAAERFYEEDRLVGNWRPWFNIDSER